LMLPGHIGWSGMGSRGSASYLLQSSISSVKLKKLILNYDNYK
jgi:hypothetical protein